MPDETGGPYPGDGSNGVNVLDDSGIVRSDIRSSFGSSTTVAEGVPLTIELTVRDAATGSALVGAGVYLWHCDRDGNYSLYSRGLENENYLRGVQATDAIGTVRFTSIYPACYSGRWPHIHFEVYSDVANAVASGPIVKTSQIALPDEVNDVVYATRGLRAERANLSQIEPRSATWSSATTAASTRSRACRARSRTATRRRSRSACELRADLDARDGRPRAIVREQHGTLRERPRRRGEGECRWDAAGEEALARAERDRVDVQVEPIEQLELDQRLHEVTAADHARRGEPLLQGRDLGRGIGQHGRALPRRIECRVRDDELRHLVELLPIGSAVCFGQ